MFHSRVSKILLLLSMVALIPVSITLAAHAQTPSVGDVLINEFVARAGGANPSEWVELYNSTTHSLILDGMFIDDIAGGGGAPKAIPAGTTLAPGDYYVMSFGSFLNNGGDDVRLLGTDGVTVYDAYTYSSSTTDKSWCRKPDGSSWNALECDTTQGATNQPGLPGGTWTPGTLEIHVLNVGQGETQLIIGPTGRTLLIGTHEPSWNTNTGALWVGSEIQRITGSTHINYIMPSHWHLDHMGYAGNGGIWSLLEQQGFTVDKIIDRDGGHWNDANSDGICDPNTEIVWTNAGTVSGTARNWICWVDDPTTAGGQIRELAVLGSTTQINLGLADGVTTKVVQVDADGVMQVDGITPVGGDHTAETVPPSENDYSITIWLNWGQFDYVSGGDSDGEYNTSSFNYTYNDVETVVAGRINQEVEAIWVNHHGSSHSTNQTYVDMLSPQVAIASPGQTNSYGHPAQVVLDRLFNAGVQLYFPQQGDPGMNYHNAVIVNDNVVIQVTDGINFTVNGDPYVSSNPVGATPTPTPTSLPTNTPTPLPTNTPTPLPTNTPTPLPTNTPTPLPTNTPTPLPTNTPSGPRVPLVGEVVINEFVPSPKNVETSEWIELYNMTGDDLLIGGMYIDDLIGGGGSPKLIPTGTIIPAGGYYVMDGFNRFLNNVGDDVNLLGTDGTTLFDSHTYGSTGYDVSRCRVTDGGSWVSGTCTPSKGAAN